MVFTVSVNEAERINIPFQRWNREAGFVDLTQALLACIMIVKVNTIIYMEAYQFLLVDMWEGKLVKHSTARKKTSGFQFIGTACFKG